MTMNTKYDSLPEGSETRLYTKRWLMLGMNMIMIGLNGAIMNEFSPLMSLIVKVIFI